MRVGSAPWALATRAELALIEDRKDDTIKLSPKDVSGEPVMLLPGPERGFDAADAALYHASKEPAE